MKEATRRVVEEAAARLGYRPNIIARGLKTGRSGLVAMILPGDMDRSASETLFELLIGISNEMAAQGFRFVLHVADAGADPVLAYRDLYQGAGVDGFIVIEPRAEDRRISYLLEAGIPHVVHGKDPKQDHPFVDVDNYAIARRLTEAFLQAGHKRIAFLNGVEGYAFVEARRAGFADAMRFAGYEPVGIELQYGLMSPERGYDAFGRLMAMPDPPTAVLAGSTMIAAGVFRAAREQGVRIPEQVSILAHDDDLDRYDTDRFDVSLGGTRSSLKQAWRGLAKILASQIRKDPDAAPSSVLEVAFDPKSSCVAPPESCE